MKVEFKLGIKSKPKLFLKAPARISHNIKIPNLRTPVSEEQKKKAIAKRLFIQPEEVIISKED